MMTIRASELASPASCLLSLPSEELGATPPWSEECRFEAGFAADDVRIGEAQKFGFTTRANNYASQALRVRSGPEGSASSSRVPIPASDNNPLERSG